MKKQAYTYVIYPLAIIVLILTLPLLKSSPEHNLDSMLFVKAAFLDKEHGCYVLYVYATDAESGDGHHFYGSGENVAAAVKNAEKGSYKNLFYSSSELLVLGNGIKTAELLQIAEYAVKENSFPLSVATFKGRSEFASEKYAVISDAVRSRSLSGRVRLWRYAEEALKENEAPSLLNIREGEDGNIYFEG